MLHAEHRQIGVGQPFEGAVVEVHVRHVGGEVQRGVIDAKVVVLTGDHDAARSQILHGMVATVMAERQLEGGRTGR